MTDLARALVDAAAAVLPAAYDESCGASVLSPSTSPEDWTLEARAAVVAVLETLAGETGPLGWWLTQEHIQQLVAEVRGVGEKP